MVWSDERRGFQREEARLCDSVRCLNSPRFPFASVLLSFLFPCGFLPLDIIFGMFSSLVIAIKVEILFFLHLSVTCSHFPAPFPFPCFFVSGYFFSLRASIPGKIKVISWASERDYDVLNFKLYTRQGSLFDVGCSMENENGWGRIVDTSLHSVRKFTGNRDLLNRTVLPSPITLSAGEEQAFYIWTDQNCGRSKDCIGR